MYGKYQPFYKQLLQKCPELSGEGELFQFSLPPLSVAWSEMNSSQIYSFLDTLPEEASGFYIPGGRRLTDVYRDYLYSLDSLSNPAISRDVEAAILGMETDSVDLMQNGTRICAPNIAVSKSESLFDEPLLKFNFTGDMWAETEEPVTLGEGIGLSQLTGIKKYSFEIAAEGLRCCEIIRGNWYSEKLLHVSEKFLEGSMFKQKNFIGKNGAFSLIPQKVLFVDKLRMFLDIQTLSRTKNACANGAKDMAKSTRAFRAPKMPFNAFACSFLGIPVELNITSEEEPLCVENSAPEFFSCFHEGNDITSILGVTSKKL